MSVFNTQPAPDYGPQLFRDLRVMCPQVVMVMHRSKNKNVVVVAANMTKKGVLDQNNPVDIFWLDLEPSYMKARRDKGITHDREELNFLERKWAWGTTSNVLSPTHAQFSFAAEPEQLFDVVVQNGVPNLFTTWLDNQYMIRTAFVDATEQVCLNMKDNVKELSLQCINLKTKQPEVVYIVGGP